MKRLLAVAFALVAACAASAAQAQSSVSRHSYTYAVGQSHYHHSWRAAPRDFFRDRGCCLGRHDFFRTTGRYHWPGDVYRGREPRYRVLPVVRVPSHRTVLRVHARVIAVQAHVVRR